MITSLSIKNYALIEDVLVQFNKGFTVITGETGAGKSILLNALGLVLGNRADLKIARDPEQKCCVEAEFSIAPYGLESFFSRHEMVYEPETIIRREIYPSGKSRAFVNDSPVTLQQLQSLSEFLIDIHNQSDTRKLHSESYQMSIVDAMAGSDILLRDYKASLRDFKKASEDLESLEEQKATALREQDYQEFIYTELQEARLQEKNQASLEETYERLNHLEEIQEHLGHAMDLLQAESSGGLDLISEVRNQLQRIQSFGKSYESLWERINSVWIELDDINEEISALAESLEADPSALEAVETSLQELYKLQKKHAVGSVAELLELQQSLEQNLSDFSALDERIEVASKECVRLEKQTRTRGDALYEKRANVLKDLEAKLTRLLAELGLPYAKFEFRLLHGDHFSSSGMDTLKLYFTANKGVNPGPIEKVASGGELSRVMLAIKSVLSEYKNLPTIILDEIDTGVSGEIAHKMAMILSRMSQRGQLLGITHLPQTAAKGDYHKKVFKMEDQGMSRTLIKDLEQEDRILEIAQMIGGSSVSDSAITHAKQLLN